VYTISLFDPGQAVGAPPGFLYIPDLLSAEEESNVLALAEGQAFVPYVIRDQPSKRRMAFVGGYSDGERRALLPEVLLPLRARVAAAAGLRPERYTKALLQVYPVGAGIGFHRDYDQAGDAVIGFNLLGPCFLKLRSVRDRRRVFIQELRPRSAYVLGGETRHRWLHGIPPVKSERWSLTLRGRTGE